MPDDPWFEEMNPVVRAWMYNNWVEDFGDDYKLLENQGYLIGSFIDPEKVKKILGTDKHESTDEDFEETSKMVLEEREKEKQVRQEDKPKRKRKKKIIG